MKENRRSEIHAACEQQRAATTAAEAAQAAYEQAGSALEFDLSRSDFGRDVQRSGTIKEYLDAITKRHPHFLRDCGETFAAKLENLQELEQASVRAWAVVKAGEAELAKMETEVSDLFTTAMRARLGSVTAFLDAALRPLCKTDADVKPLIDAVPRVQELRWLEANATNGTTPALRITNLLGTVSKLQSAAAADLAATQS